jgi:mRNA export factor
MYVLFAMREREPNPLFYPKTVKRDPPTPTLCTAFSSDEKVILGGGDKSVRVWQFDAEVVPLLGEHDAPVNSVGFLPSINLVVSGGWDKKLKFWDPRQQNPATSFDMPGSVHAMDVRDRILVVGTSDHSIISYDVPPTSRTSILKIQHFESAVCTGAFMSR